MFLKLLQEEFEINEADEDMYSESNTLSNFESTSKKPIP